jgi:protein-tyrosine kinase
MSRIHEALKKAESERGAAQSMDVAAPLAAVESVNHNGRPAPSKEVLTQVSTGTVVLGAELQFEDVLAHCAHPRWNPEPRMNLFLNSSKHVHSTEQLRTLRSRLYQFRSQERLRIILVTSAIPGEGKTFVAGNLAQAIVRQHERRTLLVDADLRCPRQHLALGAPLMPGLSHYLSGDADEMAVIQHGQEGNLCFVPGGQTVANPTELLSTGRLKTLLERVAPAFDWVLVDSPPCLPVADARLLADVCDGIVLVVKAGSTPLELVQKAQQTFQGKKILGVVLNGVEEDGLGYRSYYRAYSVTS